MRPIRPPAFTDAEVLNRRCGSRPDCAKSCDPRSRNEEPLVAPNQNQREEKAGNRHRRPEVASPYVLPRRPRRRTFQRAGSGASGEPRQPRGHPPLRTPWLTDLSTFAAAEARRESSPHGRALFPARSVSRGGTRGRLPAKLHPAFTPRRHRSSNGTDGTSMIRRCLPIMFPRFNGLSSVAAYGCLPHQTQRRKSGVQSLSLEWLQVLNLFSR